MSKKAVQVFRLEDRVLFEAGAVIQAAEAAAANETVAENQVDQSAENQESADNGGSDAGENAEDAAAQSEDSNSDDAAANVVLATEEGAEDANGAQDDIADFSNTTEQDSAENEIAFAESPLNTGDALPSSADEKVLVVINTTVNDSEAIVNDLGDNYEVLYLNSDSAALDQINAYLDANGNTQYSAIHFVTHGKDGAISLAGDKIDINTLNPADWKALGEHLTGDADILFYSCDLASSDEGKAFADAIANLTGADVAASTDTTGNAGDWDLEYQTGLIEEATLAPQNYAGRLATEITVTIDGTNDFSELQTAITDLEAGGTIKFAVADTFAMNMDTDGDGTADSYGINVTETLAIAKNITIDGWVDLDSDGAVDAGERITLDGGDKFGQTVDGVEVTTHSGNRIMNIASGNTVSISNMQFQHGYVDGSKQHGAAIHNSGNLTVSDSVFWQNRAYSGQYTSYGGAVYNAGTILVERSVFSANESQKSSVVISGSPSADGGAFGNEGGTATIIDSVFTNNKTKGNGGAIYNSGSLTVSDSEFTSNESVGFGGTIFTTSKTSSLTVSDSIFRTNSASRGGAIAIYNGAKGMIERSYFDGNTGDRGAVTSYISDYTVINSTFVNHAAYAVGIYQGGNVLVLNSTFANNAQADIYTVSTDAVVNVYNSILSGKIAASTGTGSSVNVFNSTYTTYSGTATFNASREVTADAELGSVNMQIFGTDTPTANSNNVIIPTMDAAVSGGVAFKVTPDATTGVNTLQMSTDGKVWTPIQSDTALTDAHVQHDQLGSVRGATGSYSKGAVDKEAASLTVTTTNDAIDAWDGKTSLREAITYAQSGNAEMNWDSDGDGTMDGYRIIFSKDADWAKTGMTINVTSELAISKNISIDGWVDLDSDEAVDAGERITLDGGHTVTTDVETGTEVHSGNRVMKITGSSTTVSLSNLQIQNGYFQNTGLESNDGGAGISNAGILTLDNVIVRDNYAVRTSTATKAVYGGGIYNTGKLTVTDSQFIANKLDSSNPSGGQPAFLAQGAGIYNSGTLNVTGTLFQNNAASHHGGGIFNAGTATIRDSEFTGNGGTSSQANGGGINSSGTLYVYDSVFANNKASGASGGGISITNGTATIDGSLFDGNSANAYGAAVAVTKGSAYILNSTIVNHTLTGTSGGAVGTISSGSSNSVKIYVVNSTFAANATDVFVRPHNGGVVDIQIYNSILSSKFYLYNATTAGSIRLNNTIYGSLAGTGTGDILLDTCRQVTASDELGSVNMQLFGTETPTVNGNNVVIPVMEAAVSGGTLIGQLDGAFYYLSGTNWVKASNTSVTLTFDAGKENYGLGETATVYDTDQLGGVRGASGTYSKGAVDREAASLTVTTTDDVVDAWDGKTTLREAFIYADATSKGNKGPLTVKFADTIDWTGNTTITLDSTLGVMKTNSAEAQKYNSAVVIDGALSYNGTAQGNITIKVKDSFHDALEAYAAENNKTLDDLTAADVKTVATSATLTEQTIFNVSRNTALTLQNMTLEGGNGATIITSNVYAVKTLTVDNVIFDGGVQTSKVANDGNGGLISGTRYTTLNISNSILRYGYTAYEGGAIYATSTNAGGSSSPFTITNTLFEHNYAAGNGGAISLGNSAVSATIVDATFNNNYSNANGGAIYQKATDGTASYLTLINSTLINNAAKTAGGAYYLNDTIGTTDAVIINSTLYKNTVGEAANDVAAASTAKVYLLNSYYSSVSNTELVDVTASQQITDVTNQFKANGESLFFTTTIGGVEHTYMTPADDTANGNLVVYDSAAKTLTADGTTVTLGRALPQMAQDALSVDLFGNSREIATGKYSFGAVNGEITASEPVTTEVTLDWTIGDYTYDGTDQTVTVKVMNGETIVDTVEVTYTLNETAVGALHNAGEYTVTVNETDLNTILGDEYVLATDGVNLSQTVTVKQAQLTIKADNKTITEGDAVGELTYTVTEFEGTDTLDAAQISGTPATTADGTTAGEFDITVSDFVIGNETYNTNYKLAYVPGTLTVEAAVPENVYSLVVNDADTTKDYVINFSDSKVTLTEALYIISNHSTLGITDLTTIEGYTDGVFNITFDSSVFTGEMSTVYLADTHDNNSTWSSQIVVMNGDVDGDGDADITVNTNNRIIVTSNNNTTVKNLIFTGSTGSIIFRAFAGKITFEDVTFTGNSGDGFLLYGGTASKTFINCTITDNSNTWLFQNNGGGDWNFINTTISTGDKGIYKPLSGTNSLNVNFINSIVLSDSSTALSDNATNSSIKFNFYKSVTNITTDKVSTANKDLVTYTDSVVDAALTAADIFGSNTLDSEGVLAIDGTGKAANGGTLVGKLNGAYYYLDGANWVKVGDTATTKTFDSAAANYGLGDGATVYATGQNGGDRTIAMNYGQTYGINGVYNAGAYAINSVEERSLVVDNTADNINPFDGKTTLREAFIYAMESTRKTISFSDAVDWTNDNVITLDADLGTLHWLREKYLTINGALKYNGTDQGRITIRVEHTLKDALLAYAEANGKTLDDLTAADVATVATDPNTVLTEHSIFDSTYLCTVNLSNLILEGGGSAAKDGGIFNIGYQSHTHTFTNVLFEGSVAKNGGAVSLDGNYYNGASFTDTVFRFNYAQNGGAIYAACTSAGKPPVSTNNVLFDRNAAAIGGGALALIGGNATANILNTTFTGNQAASGGAIYQDAAAATGYLVAINTTFLNNTATHKGGAYRMDASSDAAPTALFINSTFYGNREAADAANDVSTTGAAVHLLNSYYAAVSSDDATKTVDTVSSMKIADAAEQFTANGETLYHTYTKNNVTHTYLKPAHNTADGYQVVYDSTAKTVTAGESTVAITLNATMSAAINKDLTGANRGLATGIYSFGAVNGTYTPPVEVTLDWSAVENEYIYNGSNQTIEVKVLDGNGKEVDGLTVTLTYNDAAAMLNAGEYEIKVDTDALSEIFKKDYVLADGVETSKTITVKPAELKVKANDKTITAGEAVGELTYTVTGLFGSDNANITGALETTADGSTAGEYAITRGSLAVGNTNYVLNDADFTNGTLTVEANVVPDDPNRTVTTLDDTTVADDGLVSLREAIAYAKANGGGTITFASSLSGGTITLASSLTIDFTDSITIDGDINNDGVADITLSGDNARRILNISIDGADVTLEGLIFADGKATNGGALAVTKENVTLNISNSVFTGNTSTEAKAPSGGGAIYISGANMELNISNSTFSGNTATKHGGAIQIVTGTDVVVSITDSRFENNTALGTEQNNQGGGAINFFQNTGVMRIHNSVFESNSTESSGGAITAYIKTVDFADNVFKNNTATRNAGAVLIASDVSASNYMVIENSLFDGNHAGYQGGATFIAFDGNSAGGGKSITTSILNSTFINNSAVYAGGALFYKENATGRQHYVANSTFLGNSTEKADEGVTSGTTANYYTYGGGAIHVGRGNRAWSNHNTNTNVQLFNSILLDNTAGGVSSDIYCFNTSMSVKSYYNIYTKATNLHKDVSTKNDVTNLTVGDLFDLTAIKKTETVDGVEKTYYVTNKGNSIELKELAADSEVYNIVNRTDLQIGHYASGANNANVVVYRVKDSDGNWGKWSAGTDDLVELLDIDQNGNVRLPYYTAGAAQYLPALMWSVADDGTVTKWSTLADVVTQLQSDHSTTAGVYYFTPSALDLGQITVNGSITLIGYSQDSALDGTFVLDGTDNVTVDALQFTADATVDGGTLTFNDALLSGNGTIAINSGLLNVVNTTVYDFSGTITIDGTNGLGQIVSSTIHSNSGTIAGNGKLNILNTIVTDTANLSGYTAKYSVFDIAGSGATNTYNVAADDIFGTELVWNGLVLTTLAASSASAHANGALTAINGTNLYYSTDGSTWYDFNGIAVSEDISSYVLKVDAMGNQRIILNGKAAAGAFSSLTETKTLTVTTSQDIVDEYDGYISLREAILYATDYGITAADGTATITFDLAAIKAATGEYAIREVADGTVRIDLKDKDIGSSDSSFVVSTGKEYTIDGTDTGVIIDTKLSGIGVRAFYVSGGKLTLKNITVYGSGSDAEGDLDLGTSTRSTLRGAIIDITSGVLYAENTIFARSNNANQGNATNCAAIHLKGNGAAHISGGAFNDNYGVSIKFYNTSTASTITGTTFSGNQGTNKLHIIEHQEGNKTTYRNLIVTENNTGRLVYCDRGSPFSLYDSVIYKNTFSDTSMRLSSNTTISGCTITNNSFTNDIIRADSYSSNQYTLIFQNNTITGNTGTFTNVIEINPTSTTYQYVYLLADNTVAGNSSSNAFNTLYVANNRPVTLINNIFADTEATNDISAGGTATTLYAFNNITGGRFHTNLHPLDDSNITASYADIFGTADPILDVANGVKTLAIDPESVAAYGGTLVGKIGNVFYYVSGGNWINAADGTTFGAFDSTDTTAYGLTNGTVYTTGSNGGDRLIATDYGVYNMGAHALTELLDNNLSAADKLIVNVQGDRFNPFDGKITLREAMDFVQKDTTLESYTVTFAENMQDAEIKLGLGLVTGDNIITAFVLNGKTVTIDGTDRNIVLQIGGNGAANQIFSLTGGTKLTLNDISFRGSSVYTPADGENAATLSGSDQNKAIADMNNAQLTINGGVIENFTAKEVDNSYALIYTIEDNVNKVTLDGTLVQHNNATIIGSHDPTGSVTVSDVVIAENLGHTLFILQNTSNWNFSNVTVRDNDLTTFALMQSGGDAVLNNVKIYNNKFSSHVFEWVTSSEQGTSVIKMDNSTIANNTLASGKSVFYLTGAAANNLTLTNNTIANNAGGNGITVTNTANTVTMINNIVVGQINDLNVTAGTVNAKYNVYGINTGATLDKTNVESNMATEFGGTPDVNADGTLTIVNTAKAAYTGTLTAVNGSNIYYVDNSNNYWYKMGGAATETFGLFVNDSTTNYGLTVEGAAVNTTAQNGTSRLTAADYFTFNAGAYALDTLGTTGTEVTSVEDNRNVFDDVITLREAVLHANATADEQTVTFASTLTSDKIQLTEDILITDDIVIDGTFGSGRITVNAAATDRVFKINDRAGLGTNFANGKEVYTAFDATIRNLNMTGGNIAGAGEVKSAATTIINTGSAIAAYQTNLALENVSINGGNGVGIFTEKWTETSLTLNNVTVENITGGRAVLAYSKYQTYNNVVFRNNKAGAIENGWCNGAIIINSHFEGNSASSHGGAINGVFALIENSTFLNNTCNMNGSAIQTSGNTLFNNVSVIGNTSKGDKGGAIFLNGNDTYTMINCTIANNISQGTLDDIGDGYGAGAINTEIGNNPTLNLINTTITGNQGVHVGGIDMKGGKLNLYNSIVAGNTTTGESLGDDIRSELGNSSITIQEVTAYNSVSSYFTDADAEEALDANGNFVWDLSGRAFLGELVSSTTPGGTYVKVAENSLLQNMNSSEVTVYTDAASGRISGIKVGDTQVYGNSGGTESNLAADQAGTDLLDGKVYTTIGSVAVEHKEIVSLTVTTGDDVVSGSDNKTSLREALAAAESGSPYTFGVLSDLGDGITFDAAVTTVNVADDLTIGTDISIDGGSGVTINVADGKTLAVAEDKAVTVEGTLALNGTAENNGTLNVADGAVLTVDAFTNNGSMTVTGDLAKTADGTFASGADSSVTYNGSETTQNVLSGEGVTYADLVIATTAAEATGAITAANITVNKDKSLTAASIETTGNVTANGTMDVSGAATVGGDLNANADVTVNGKMSVSGNTVIANGATLDLNGAEANLGTISNSGAITVSGDMTSSNKADASMGDVTYDGADGQQIAAGMYDDLTVTAGSKSTSGDITVSGNADMNAALSTDDNVAFNGTVEGSGSVNATAGSVSYGEAAGNVLGGTYNDVTVNGDAATTSGDITVSGNADMNAALSTDDNVTFNGTVSGDGSINATAGSVSYGENAGNVLGGTYNDVTVSGDAATTDAITVNGTADVGGKLSTDDNVAFNGTVSGDGSINATAGSVSYGENAGNVLGGTYNDVTVSGDAATTSGDITVSGNADMNAALSTDDNVTFSGTVSGDGSINATAGSVSYGEAAENVLGGTYNDVSVSGDATTMDNITVNGAADVDGKLSTDDNVAFNGAVSGDGSINATAGSVSYGENAGSVLGGTYNDVTVSGDAATTNNITVNGAANVDGKLSTDDNVAFNGTVEGSGSINATAGSVSYGEAAGNVLGGTYNDVTVSGDATTTDNITVNGAADVDGKLSTDDNMTFSGAVSGDGSINATAGSVSYNGTGDQTILNGSYNALALENGSKTLGGNVTVSAENGFSASSTTLKGATGATLTVNDTGNGDSQNSAITGTTFQDIVISNSATGGDGNLYINADSSTPNNIAGTVSGIRLVAELTVTAGAITYGDTMGSIILTVTNASGEQLYKGTVDELGWIWAAGNDAIENATENQAYSVDSGESTYYYNGDVNVVINKRVIQVKAQSYTITAGDALPKFLYSYIGELVGVDAFTGALICSGDGSAAGTYQILQGSLTLGDNYEIVFSAGTLTVEAAPESGGKNAINATQMPDQYNNIIMAEPDVTYQNRRDLHYLYGDACMIETFNGSVGKHYGYDPGIGLRGKTIVANTREIRLSHIVQKPGEGLMPIISTPDAEGNVRGGEFSDGETTMNFLRGGHTREEYEWDKVDFSDLLEAIDFDIISKNELFEDEVDEAIAEMTGVIV